MDVVDRRLLAALQRDAGSSYAALGAEVGLSAGSAHERVRKLRERGVLGPSTVRVDPESLGLGVLAFVLVDGGAWLGDRSTSDALGAVAEVEEAHVVAGSASLLLKVRTASTGALQEVLRRLYAIEGVGSTEAIVVLDTFFERPTAVPQD